jgi:hypothetical protein
MEPTTIPQHCNCCDEVLVFAVRNKDGTVFHMGLSFLIECLAEAVLEGELPKLPPYWAEEIYDRHNIRIPAKSCEDKECLSCNPYKAGPRWM